MTFAIASSFATRFEVNITQVRTALKAASIVQYGGLTRLDSLEGDTMRCYSSYKPSQDARDPTFVRVSRIADQDIHEI